MVLTAVTGLPIEQVDLIEIERAPDRATAILHDRTAFDAYVEYRSSAGDRAFLGIETKYLAFTHMLLANPPFDAPKPLRPIINAAARRIANRFIATYRKIGPHPVDPATFDWYRNLQGCRVLTDLAGWRAAGELDAHRGHPWLTIEPTLQVLVEH